MDFRRSLRKSKIRMKLRVKHLEFITKNKGEMPSEVPYNSVLENSQEYIDAVSELNSLHLPLCSDTKKNWDNLAALSIVLKNTNKDSKVLDAGSEYYSKLLPSLYFYGYKNLLGNNLTFKRKNNFGRVAYEPGNITDTKLLSKSIDAVTCLSVIEHGVNIESYLKEMSRIIKPRGILFTSTDYWENPVNTGGKEAYGAPIKIFSGSEIKDAVEIAQKYDFDLVGDLKLKGKDKIVNWHGLDYTFIYFTLRKK